MARGSSPESPGQRVLMIFLVYCNDTRNKYFSAFSMEELFRSVTSLILSKKVIFTSHCNIVKKKFIVAM